VPVAVTITIEDVERVVNTAIIFPLRELSLVPILGISYILFMRIIKQKTLIDYWSTPRYEDAQSALEAWYNAVDGRNCDWATPNDVKADYRNASIVANNRVVFNINGNNYRLVVKINYPYRVVYIRWFGTHDEYDAIDVTTV
jgi:mRNA interferase HigB